MLDGALQRRLQTGQNDPRSAQGILSRGTNIYNGGSSAAHSGGGPQFGRPRENPQPVDQSTNGGNPMDKFSPDGSGELVNMDPLPVNPMKAAILRRMKGNSQGSQNGY